MSKKVPEEIDLNCDAVPFDREHEGNDVKVEEPASGVGPSSTETVKEPTDEVVKDFGKDNEFASGVDELGIQSKMEKLEPQVIDLEVDIGSLGEEADGKANARLDPLMEVDGGPRRGDEESVSMEDKKPVENEEMAVGSSVGVAKDLNVNACPTEYEMKVETSVRIRSSSIAENSIQSVSACHSGSGDEKPLSSVLAYENYLPGAEQNEKEGSSGRLESRNMEIDTPMDADGKNQTTCVQDEGKESILLNDTVDLNPCASTDEDVSGDDDVKPEEPELCTNDLVWGKVRSHPWWPGQIFDRSSATTKAKKYFKKDCYLIAYFGDQTFAWNEASWIKPFRPHFSHLQKQNKMEDFHYAIDCALDEVSRRIEFGLACSCISKEAYTQIKTQIVVNAGIREESSRKDGGDRFSGAASFDPSVLVKRIKALAQSPYSEVDRLQFITSQAQLLAFHRWKGYSQLPEFQNLCGSLETDAEIPLYEEMKSYSEMIGDDIPNTKVDSEMIGDDIPNIKVDKLFLSERETSDSQNGSYYGGAKISSKKEKSLSELIAERRVNMQNSKRKLDNKAGDKSSSSSPAKKLKVADSVCDNSELKQGKSDVSKRLNSELKQSKSDVSKRLNSELKQSKSDASKRLNSELKQSKSDASTVSSDKPLQCKEISRVGASILRVASQLNGSSSTVSTPILKHGGRTSLKSAVESKTKGKSSSSKSSGKKVSQSNVSSPDEMLSKLCLAAMDPLRGHSFLVSIISFFTELRNSFAIDLNGAGMPEQKVTGEPELTAIKDSCCSDRMINYLPEEQLVDDQLIETTEVSRYSPCEKVIESTSAVQASGSLDSEQKHIDSDETFAMEAEKQISHSDENCTDDQSPTALILNFSDLDSVPSVEDLKKIFSRYGPLATPGAEVFKKSVRAKVIFRRCADAETAFSSSGKYSIFGPSLVSYRLKRLASKPSKSSPSGKRSRTDETCGDGDTT